MGIGAGGIGRGDCDHRGKILAVLANSAFYVLDIELVREQMLRLKLFYLPFYLSLVAIRAT